MNATEVAGLLTVIAAFDHRKFGEAEVLVWHEALGDLRFEESRQAVVRFFASETGYLMPAHVRKTVTAARQDAAMRVPIEGVGGRTQKPEWFQAMHDEAKAKAAPHWADVRARNKAAGAQWAATNKPKGQR